MGTSFDGRDWYWTPDGGSESEKVASDKKTWCSERELVCGEKYERFGEKVDTSAKELAAAVRGHLSRRFMTDMVLEGKKWVTLA